jgi:pimeloyl-ACP methyl ester carboxylesterase
VGQQALDSAKTAVLGKCLHAIVPALTVPSAIVRITPLPVSLALIGMLAACSMPQRPDLGRLYSTAAQSPDRTPVILIPGLFGSKLRDRATGVEVWPGGWRSVLFGDYAELALDFDPATLEVRPDDLEAYALAESVLGQDFYGPIVSTLVDFGGYVRASPGAPARPGERRLYLFPYDWRQDNVEQARGLEALIDAIRADYADPLLRVDIVAHSMGGLIARYYLRYGPRDVLDGMPSLVSLHGASRVRKLILLGTPNFGAVSALHGYLAGESIGLGRIAPEVLATLPSGYQLFPHPLATWLVDASGRALADDVFDPATWQRYGWGVHDTEVAARVRATHDGDDAYLVDLRSYFAHRLERARRFAWMLSTPEPATPIRYVLFGGNCTLTPARIAVEAGSGVARTYLRPQDLPEAAARESLAAAMLEPGDGRVTKPSLLARETLDPTAPQHEESFLPVAYHFFLCERHDQLTGNISFQDNLLNVLLTPDLPWEDRGRPRGQAPAALPREGQ